MPLVHRKTSLTLQIQSCPLALRPLMLPQPTIRAINSLCVVRGARDVTADKWPADGLCYRGGGLPHSARDFFCVGVQVSSWGFVGWTRWRERERGQVRARARLERD
jgi:hypothetical protein